MMNTRKEEIKNKVFLMNDSRKIRKLNYIIRKNKKKQKTQPKVKKNEVKNSNCLSMVTDTIL